MDRLIRRYDSEEDGDLVLCEKHGVAYQREMKSGRVRYDDQYFAKVSAYEGSEIAKAVNAGRCAMIARHLPSQISTTKWSSVLDVGAGTGAFIRALIAAGYQAKGYDVITRAKAALQAAGLYSDTVYGCEAMTMWDTIEHLEEPERILKVVPKDGLLFVSVPIFADLSRIRESKHYRPGEHLYYWTRDGFIEWAALHGFRLLEESGHEVEAGREDIAAFAFRRDLPDYRDHILAYREMHGSRHYGSSATELHFEAIAEIVLQLGPKSIIDYGCGRSDLIAHFWKDGERTLARYDPAISGCKDMPEGEFDLAFCLDVMEHIPMANVDRILQEVRAKSGRAVFTISTKLARAKLPDGRNAHVTLLTREEWTRWVAEYFGGAQVVETKWETELMLVAGAEVAQASRAPVAESEPRCVCGGEMYLDSFRDPRKPDQEWFMRCRECGKPSTSAAREDDARQKWREEAQARLS